jgi:hypothetical protein
VVDNIDEWSIQDNDFDLSDKEWNEDDESEQAGENENL